MSSKQILAQKLAKLQLKLKVDEFMENEGAEILTILKKYQLALIPYKVVFIDNISKTLIPFITEKWSEKPYMECGLINIELLVESYQHTIFEHYPIAQNSSIHYFPELDYVAVAEPEKNNYLEDFLKHNKYPNQKVRVYYYSLGLLLETQLHELLKADENEIFDSFYDNIVIFPQGWEWLMVFTSSNERRFGFVERK